MYPGKTPYLIYLDTPIHRTLKVYSAETGQSMKDLVKEPTEIFEQAVIQIAHDIEEMKMKALKKRLQEEEDARIAAEYPLKVSGHKEDPLPEINEKPEIEAEQIF